MKTQTEHFWESHERVYSRLRPTESIANPFRVGQRVNYKDGNLRHPSQVMEVVALVGHDSVKVKHPSGVVGEWLCRDMIDHDEWMARVLETERQYRR